MMLIFLLISIFVSLIVFVIAQSELRTEKLRIVVSLTTSPKRISSLWNTLNSLLIQDIQPDIIQINLPYVFLRTNETFLPLENYPFLNDSRIRVHR